MSNTPPPGWYPDSQIPGQQRYWDGAQWTEHRAPTVAAAPTGPSHLPTYGGASASPVASPEQKNWFLRHKILTGVLAFVLIIIIASAAAGSGGGDDTTASDDSTQSAQSESTKEAKPSKEAEPTEEAEPTKEAEPTEEPEAEKVIKVAAAKILKEFEGNEAAADLKYGDHQLLEVTGFVSKVDTELFHDDRYVIQVSGPDYEYAFTTVNCDGQSAEDVAKLKIGQQITVGGDFQDGGDLGIELGGCHIV